MDEELERIRKRMRDEIMSAAEGEKGWPSAPEKLTGEQLDRFVEDYGLAVIDCWAPWCGPCRMIAPIIEELAVELQGKIAFGKLNTDENRMASMKYDIRAIPTLLVFKDGALVERITGAMPKEALLARLSPYQ